jgi:hypothetical protein
LRSIPARGADPQALRRRIGEVRDAVRAAATNVTVVDRAFCSRQIWIEGHAAEEDAVVGELSRGATPLPRPTTARG